MNYPHDTSPVVIIAGSYSNKSLIVFPLEYAPCVHVVAINIGICLIAGRRVSFAPLPGEAAPTQVDLQHSRLGKGSFPLKKL
jgi:hypothetical protein